MASVAPTVSSSSSSSSTTGVSPPRPDAAVVDEAWLQYCKHLVTSRLSQPKGSCLQFDGTNATYTFANTGTALCERNCIIFPAIDKLLAAAAAAAPGTTTTTTTCTNTRHALWRLVLETMAPLFGSTTAWCVWVPRATPSHKHVQELRTIPSNAAALLQHCGACGGGAGKGSAGAAACSPAPFPYFEVWEETGMVLDVKATAASRKAAQTKNQAQMAKGVIKLSKLAATDAAGAAELATVLCDAFEVDKDPTARAAAEAVLTTRTWDDGSLTLRAAHATTAATGETVVVGGGAVLHMAQCSEAAIFEVCVKPEFRRKGIATGIMLALIDDAVERGAQRVALQASSEGVPVYERLGFQVVCGYDVLVHFPAAS